MARDALLIRGFRTQVMESKKACFIEESGMKLSDFHVLYDIYDDAFLNFML